MWSKESAGRNRGQAKKTESNRQDPRTLETERQEPRNKDCGIRSLRLTSETPLLLTSLLGTERAAAYKQVAMPMQVTGVSWKSLGTGTQAHSGKQSQLGAI